MNSPRILPALLLTLATAVAPAFGAEQPSAYQGPAAMVASRDGKTLYVANADAAEVAWVDLLSGAVVRRVSVPATPSGLALLPDGRRLIVTCAAPKSTILVLDAATGSQRAAIEAGHGTTAPVVSRDGRQLYVCNRFNNEVAVIDLPSGRQLARVPAAREPIAVALTPDGKTLLVTNHLPQMRIGEPFKEDVAASLMLIDTQTHQASSIMLPHGSNGLRGVCVAPDGRCAFVAHLLSNFESVPFRVDGGWINTNVVSVIDLRHRKVVDTVGLDVYDDAGGNPWDIACTPDGKRLCVSLAGTHELCIIDCEILLSDMAKIFTPTMGVWPIYPALGDTPWRRVRLPGKGPRPLAIVNHKVYLGEYFSDSLAVVDLAAEDPVATSIPLGPPPQLTPERRGELLFHDATLCYQHWQSCASCHPEGRVDGLNWDLLNDGEGNPKNTKSMLLSHQTPPAMAEGVRMSAEEAVRSGIKHVLFTYSHEADAEAIDAYLKSLRPMPSPHLVDGRLSPSAERGRVLFHSERVGCDRCHPAPLFTDLRAHDLGPRRRGQTLRPLDTPSLVEVWRTAPYLHDGRYATIGDLLRDGRHGLGHLIGRELSDVEIDDLVAYVLSL